MGVTPSELGGYGSCPENGIWNRNRSNPWAALIVILKRMKEFAPVVLALCLVLVGCAQAVTSSERNRTSTSSTSAIPAMAPMMTAEHPSFTSPPQEEPPEFTAFTSSTSCDPDADDANLQVVQAFVTAYNERDLERLAELVPSDEVPIADMSGIPHLGEDDWTGIAGWAERNWSVDDRFELTRLVMYDSGSVFEVERSNDILRANEIESLRHSWKVHSFRCEISRMVLYLPFGDFSGSECHYWEVFDDALAEGTTQAIQKPEACSG